MNIPSEQESSLHISECIETIKTSIQPEGGNALDQIVSISNNEKMKELDRQANILISKELYIEAFTIVEQLVLLQSNSQEITETMVNVCKRFNSYAMVLLNNSDYVLYHKLLKNVLNLLQQFQGPDIDQMVGLTLNNLSCGLKRSGNIEGAQLCLDRAKQYQNKAAKEDESALTELNLCAIHSQKKQYKRAMVHARNAINKLKGNEQNPEKAKEKKTLLAIGYYNLGCQQEHLKQLEEARESYQMATALEREKEESQLLAEFEKSYNQVKEQLGEKSPQQRKKIMKMKMIAKQLRDNKTVQSQAISPRRLRSDSEKPKRAQSANRRSRPFSAQQTRSGTNISMTEKMYFGLQNIDSKLEDYIKSHNRIPVSSYDKDSIKKITGRNKSLQRYRQTRHSEKIPMSDVKNYVANLEKINQKKMPPKIPQKEIKQQPVLKKPKKLPPVPKKQQVSIQGSHLLQLIDQGFEQIVRRDTTSIKSNDRGGSDLNSLYFQEMMKQKEIQLDNEKLSHQITKSLKLVRSTSGSFKDEKIKIVRQRPSTAKIIEFNKVAESIQQEDQVLINYDSSENTLNLVNIQTDKPKQRPRSAVIKAETNSDYNLHKIIEIQNQEDVKIEEAKIDNFEEAKECQDANREDVKEQTPVFMCMQNENVFQTQQTQKPNQYKSRNQYLIKTEKREESLNSRVQKRLRSPVSPPIFSKVKFEEVQSPENLKVNEQKITNTYKKRLEKLRNSMDPEKKVKTKSDSIKQMKIILSSSSIVKLKSKQITKKESNNQVLANLILPPNSNEDLRSVKFSMEQSTEKLGSQGQPVVDPTINIADAEFVNLYNPSPVCPEQFDTNRKEITDKEVVITYRQEYEKQPSEGQEQSEKQASESQRNHISGQVSIAQSQSQTSQIISAGQVFQSYMSEGQTQRSEMKKSQEVSKGETQRESEIQEIQRLSEKLESQRQSDILETQRKSEKLESQRKSVKLESQRQSEIQESLRTSQKQDYRRASTSQRVSIRQDSQRTSQKQDSQRISSKSFSKKASEKLISQKSSIGDKKVIQQSSYPQSTTQSKTMQTQKKVSEQVSQRPSEQQFTLKMSEKQESEINSSRKVTNQEDSQMKCCSLQATICQECSKCIICHDCKRPYEFFKNQHQTFENESPRAIRRTSPMMGYKSPNFKSNYKKYTQVFNHRQILTKISGPLKNKNSPEEAAQKIQKFWRKQQIRNKFEQKKQNTKPNVKNIKAELLVFNHMQKIEKIQCWWRQKLGKKIKSKSKTVVEFQIDNKIYNYLVQVFEGQILLICNNQIMPIVVLKCQNFQKEQLTFVASPNSQLSGYEKYGFFKIVAENYEGGDFSRISGLDESFQKIKQMFEESNEPFTIFEAKIQNILIKIKVHKNEDLIILKSNTQKIKFYEPKLKQKSKDQIIEALKPILVDLKIENGIIQNPILRQKKSEIIYSNERVSASVHGVQILLNTKNHFALVDRDEKYLRFVGGPPCVEEITEILDKIESYNFQSLSIFNS